MSRIYTTGVRATASSLHASGLSIRQISTELDIPRSTVGQWLDPDAYEKMRNRKESYSGTCIDCGALTTGCNGRDKAPLRCISCFNAASTIWTRGAIIGAIRLYAHRYGGPPGAVDWNPTQARGIGRDDWADRFYADGDYPLTFTVQRAFGSWSAGIQAAGYTPRGVGKRGPARPRA